MQSDSTAAWSSGVPNTGDEFTNFLEYADLDIDFPEFESQTQTQHAQIAQQPQAIPDQNGIKQGYDAAAYYEHMRQQQQQALQKGGGSAGDLQSQMSGIQMRQNGHQMQHASYSQQMYPPGRIPPTPSSTDLHGGHPQLVVDAHQAAMFEARMRKQQEQMAFTPLGTPAVTPMDTHFQIREYTVPGEYFSPLASPALHAQNQPTEGQIYYPFQMSDVSGTTSPVDMSFDPSLKPTTNRRQQKKRSPGSTSKPSPRKVRQSPAMKAQKKKTTSTIIPAKEVKDVLAKSGRPATANGSQSLGLPPTNMSSESPEPLLDMMPPPAIPSTNRSPYIAPGSQSVPIRTNAPVTPTSLLKMNSAPMRDLSLGEAALDTEDTLMIDAPTPNLSAIPTTSAVTAISTSMSPPSNAPTPKLSSKSNFKALKGGSSKKRTSSSHPSPALRPKISPSIKPLLPEGLLNAETSALLLASKSNYQNILDGTHLPGVTYPEALSENLTSKRTSHKIAEQGRRNRINTALQEIAALLPQASNGHANANGNGSNSSGGTNGGASDGAGAGGNVQSTSKASTVEQAIDYIKSLQRELLGTQEKLKVAENRIIELEGTTSTNNTSNDGGDDDTLTLIDNGHDNSEQEENQEANRTAKAESS